ncbi:MAG TPA: tetratricopeptide repeat protein [Bryobacteraceae bacterium]|jgi:tetratricopeptide (TPR) repeat protein|nr:tetratricopeptide repeat protein [Bryobacteraceae bacterium]
MKFAFLVFFSAAFALAQSDDIFARLAHAFPDPARAGRAVSELRAAHFTTVKQLLEQQSAETPEHRPELLALAADVEFLNGDMPSAVRDFTAADPLSEADNFTLAMALVKLGNDDRARTILTTLSRKHPDRAIYIYWLGRLDYDQRRYQEAVAKLTRAVELDPNAPRAWDSLGLAFDMQGQMQLSLNAFEKASTLNRNQPHPSAWPPHNLGYLLLRMNQPEAAVTALEESLRYDPSLAIAHYHLARALEKLGRTGDAIVHYKQAIALDRTSTDACYSLATLYRKLNRKSEADEMFAEYRRRKSTTNP